MNNAKFVVIEGIDSQSKKRLATYLKKNINIKYIKKKKFLKKMSYG